MNDKVYLTNLNLLYNPTEEEWEKSVSFSKEVYSSTSFLYRFRGSTNKNKIIQDHAFGKITEIAAYRLLKPHIKSISYPDFSTTTQKSYSPDLVSNKYNFHVKSTSNKEEPSWVFQVNDPIVSNSSPGENLALLFVITSSKASHLSCPPEVMLKHIVPLNGYRKWRLPFLSKYRQTKRILSEKDITSKLSFCGP
jgi:hypothetical protein